MRLKKCLSWERLIFIMSVDTKSIVKALDSRKVFVAMLVMLVLASVLVVMIVIVVVMVEVIKLIIKIAVH